MRTLKENPVMYCSRKAGLTDADLAEIRLRISATRKDVRRRYHNHEISSGRAFCQFQLNHNTYAYHPFEARAMEDVEGQI
jgi:hypothetical protein